MAAAARRGEVVPVYIWSPEEEDSWPPGAASRWWLHRSLTSLSEDLKRQGSRLIVRSGPTLDVLKTLARETKSDAVYWSRRYEPAVIARDEKVKAGLAKEGISVETFNGSLLFEPSTIRSQSGKPYQVFTAFWRACMSLPPPSAPSKAVILSSVPGKISSLSIDELQLRPRLNWADGFSQQWTPGEKGAERALGEFLRQAVSTYQQGRDIPSEVGTSRLSPHLHFGEISPRTIWTAVEKLKHKKASTASHAQTYLKELGWREFAHHLLFHFPHTTRAPLNEKFSKFPWRTDKEALRRWQRGQTGYPIVDAGLRELWKTGWMHNRVRMIVASFLVKDLRLSWVEGAKWFWDTLVDADLANNTLGWQWSAGCGADAAPYFRIFNPVLQSQRFDPSGNYIRRWIPELGRLPEKYLHAPWTALESELTKAGVTLGKNYPHPMVDHAAARDAALAAFKSLPKSSATFSAGAENATLTSKISRRKFVQRTDI